jgi:ABC-2 type transport system permease protein
MFSLHIKKFLRNKAAVTALLITFCIGVVSIYAGNTFLQKQYHAIDAAARYQQEHIERHLKYENNEFGLLMYYLKFAYVNKPLPITALAIGQRDVNSSIQAVTIRGLEAQKYDTDLQNPFNLMMGNVDLSFVIIYIFPLLIITLTFNLLSEEKENGTWRLVYTQTSSSLKYLLQKIMVAAMFTIAVLALLFLFGVIIIGIPVNAVLLQFAGVSVLYMAFWFCISFFIVSLNKTSGVNAVLLLSTWLLLTIVLPAAVNNYISTKYPVPEALSTMLKQRDGYHRKWDVPEEQTMQQFVAAYPQYKNVKWTHDGFNWLWYYAMQHSGDIEAAADSKAFMQKLQQRNLASNSAALFIPSVNLQLQHNELAQSGLTHYIDFLKGTAIFHEKQRLYFYHKIFAASPVMAENWNKHKLVYHKTEAYPLQWLRLVVYFIFCFISIVVSVINFKKYGFK